MPGKAAMPGMSATGAAMVWRPPGRPGARSGMPSARLRCGERRHGVCSSLQRKETAMSNDEIVDTLNDLIETCKDGEFGFTACAKHTQSSELRSLFLQRAAECKTGAAELQPYVVQYGGKPDTGGSASGALHRGWVAVRGSLTGYSDQAMLEECER